MCVLLHNIVLSHVLDTGILIILNLAILLKLLMNTWISAYSCQCLRVFIFWQGGAVDLNIELREV